MWPGPYGEWGSKKYLTASLDQSLIRMQLDYVDILEKRELEKFYRARRLFSKLCASKKFELKFKLEKGDLIMFDNHRTLHGRTSFDQNEGKRFLKGCYIDHDSTEGKLRFLERKFNLKWKK